MLAATLPMTATPSAPPSSRTVSFTAEPTPARAGGSVAMISSVAAGMAMPAPRPNSRSPTPVGRYEVPSTNAACTATPPAASSVPVTTAMRPPSWPARWAPTPLPRIIPMAAGTRASAGGERGVAEDELQVLRLEEHGAGHGEEQHGEGDAAGGEAAVRRTAACRASARRVAAPSGRTCQPATAATVKIIRVELDVQPLRGASMMA